MNNLPIELVNEIIMMSRPTYSYMSELKRSIEKKNRSIEKKNLNLFYGKSILGGSVLYSDTDSVSLYPPFLLY